MDKLVLKLASVAGPVSTRGCCARCLWLRDHYRCAQLRPVKQERLLCLSFIQYTVSSTLLTGLNLAGIYFPYVKINFSSMA